MSKKWIDKIAKERNHELRKKGSELRYCLLDEDVELDIFLCGETIKISEEHKDDVLKISKENKINLDGVEFVSESWSYMNEEDPMLIVG